MNVLYILTDASISGSLDALNELFNSLAHCSLGMVVGVFKPVFCTKGEGRNTLNVSPWVGCLEAGRLLVLCCSPFDFHILLQH